MNKPIKPYKKSTGGGKSNIIFTLLLTILFLMPTLGAKAQTNEPYVVLKDSTATFYYNSSKPNGALPIPSQRNDANWPEDTRNSVTKVVFDASFKDYEPTSCVSWFCDFEKLTEISGIKENLNTANVKNMGGMFEGCSCLTTLDVSNFNTANVTTMERMFRGCSSLTTLDVSNFNTANVTSMESMFAGCKSLTSLDLSRFNTENVKTMESLFQSCHSLTSLTLSNFNTANVTTMKWMFYGCRQLATLDLSNFNTANVTKMNGMFWECYDLNSVNVSSFNTEQVTEMGSMFGYCTSLTSIDLSSFNTAKVTTMTGMFHSDYKLAYIVVSDDWNMSSVTLYGQMFLRCTNLFGGKGTRCTGADSHIDATYAKIDGGESDPGYLTKSGEPIFKGIISIEISTMPKTDYKVGEDFEIADGTLTLTYNNGETETINLSDATISGYDKTKIGEQTLKIEYQGVETTLTTPVSFIPDTQTDVKVWSYNSTIYLETLPDTKYTIIDLNGRVIKSASTKSSHEEISIAKSGVYIVLVNGESYKVSIN